MLKPEKQSKNSFVLTGDHIGNTLNLRIGGFSYFPPIKHLKMSLKQLLLNRSVFSKTGPAEAAPRDWL